MQVKLWNTLIILAITPTLYKAKNVVLLPQNKPPISQKLATFCFYVIWIYRNNLGEFIRDITEFSPKASPQTRCFQA